MLFIGMIDKNDQLEFLKFHLKPNDDENQEIIPHFILFSKR